MPREKGAEPAGGQDLSQASVPQSVKWEAEGFRVKWIAGKGIGQSHAVETEAEALILLRALKAALPHAIGWKIIAIRSRMET